MLRVRYLIIYVAISTTLCALLASADTLFANLVEQHIENEEKPQQRNIEQKPDDTKPKPEAPSIDLSKHDSIKSGVIPSNIDPKEKQKISNNSTVVVTTTKPAKPVNNVIKKGGTEVESGALMRGVWVFVGISLVFFIYVGVKTYRNKSPKQFAMVRKYGVRTRRNDLEMEPLPLDDDEDETVFDLGNFNTRA